MAYDKQLAGRVRKIIEHGHEFDEKKMFGGICWLFNGNMAGGIIKEELIVRVGQDNYESALAKPGVRVFDVTGRIMKGWVMVAGTVLDSDDVLSDWVDKGVEFALSLPSK